MDWRRRIVAHPDVLVGKPAIKGTRISVELVMDLLAAGYTTRQILDQYDHLTVEDVQACLAYAREVIRSERVYAVKKQRSSRANGRSCGVVLLRIPWTDPIADNLFAVSTLTSRESWSGIFAVVERDRIRVRPLPARGPSRGRPETE
jgi:uncharacterized protein (DUF433 family)